MPFASMKLAQGPIHEIFEKNIENWEISKTHFFLISHFGTLKKIFFFYFIPMKKVTKYVTEWMGFNFDVFPGFQEIPCYA